MSATARSNWFWTDWLGDPAVRRLTLAERGLWIDLLGLAATASPYGYVCDEKGTPLTLDEIARVTNAASPDEVGKLVVGILAKGAASRDRAGRLFNRRMVREAELRAKRQLAGAVGGAATRERWQQKILPGHLLGQVPQQTRTSESSKQVRKKEEPTLSAGLLATALPTGALARPPCTEQDARKQAAEKKPPTLTTRAELEELYGRKQRQSEAGI